MKQSYFVSVPPGVSYTLSALEGLFDWLKPIVEGRVWDAKVVVTIPDGNPKTRRIDIDTDSVEAVEPALKYYVQISKLVAGPVI